jgi:hypothetical protein
MRQSQATRTVKRRGRWATIGVPTPRELLDARPTPDVVVVAARSALSIDGQGPPGGDAFERAIGALYGVAWTLKMSRKQRGQGDFTIGPLEARWWSDGPDRPLPDVPRDSWRWRLRLAMPGGVYATEVANTVRAARSKRGGKLEGGPEAALVHLETIPAERLGRILHVGRYADEGRSFARLLTHLAGVGLKATNRHLEVYLRDPRRTAPRNLETALLLELEP